jgi:thiol-disulfide isomerase/thioredoxin
MKRNNLSSLVLIAAVLSFSAYAHAEIQLNRFVIDSYKDIVTQYQKNSFLMVLWSVDCPPCIEELPALGRFHQLHPDANVVMVSTDSNNQQEDIKRLMNKHGLADIQQWVFDDESVQAIRYAIDPAWYGELPRSYFHRVEHERLSRSGRLDEGVLLSWIKTINSITAGL